MSEQALFIFLGVVTFINLGGVISVGRIIKNYGVLDQMVKSHDKILDPEAYGKLIATVSDHERVLHDGLIDSIEEIGRKVAVFDGCPEKIDAMSKDFSELKGEIKQYMKMKK